MTDYDNPEFNHPRTEEKYGAWILFTIVGFILASFPEDSTWKWFVGSISAIWFIWMAGNLAGYYEGREIRHEKIIELLTKNEEIIRSQYK